ncbi:hypothetical protein MSP8886_00323 [Marinomonas spartinae]|uniref:Uncharacterized protein n=1 Tax=Marinomonas spartinae TaxID=1792290 RepID=A0A1A8T102_9GAMM|nr:hypothetical protein [Marinomonas spartinae]SBS25596.1 hypothetical protein MSP8886_00323 [Marinomonas spartinae]
MKLYSKELDIKQLIKVNMSNISIIINILALIMTLSLFLTSILTVVYYFKIVRKIDTILASHGVDKDGFDITWGRFKLYKRAILTPDFFDKDELKERLFDPELFLKKITPIDRKIIKTRAFFSTSFIVTLIFLIIYDSFIK